MPELIFPKFAVGTWERPVAGVYKFTIDDSYFYIGSSVHLRRRLDQWKGHILSRYGERYSPSVKRLIPNSKRIVFEIIEFADKDIIRDRENYYLKKYIDDPLFINQSPTATDNYGYKIIDDNGNHPKPFIVRKYDSKGNFIKEYRSVKKCAEGECVKIYHVQRVLSGERKRLKGFIYKADKYPQKGNSSIKTVLERKKGRRIHKLNADGELIEIFTRITDAAKSVGTTAQNVRRVLSGIQKTSGGFIFKFA